MEYDELQDATRCLQDVLSQSSQGFSLGESSFCACHAADGRYYLVCHDRVVIRMSESEAKELCVRLCESRNAMEQRASTPTRLM